MKTPLIWISIAALSFLMGLVMPYFEGRTNSWWIVPPLLPAELIPVLSLLASFFALFVLLVDAIIFRRHRLPIVSLFVLSFALLVGRIFIIPADIFHRGFHSFAQHTLTDEEWRAIARFAQLHISPECGFWRWRDNDPSLLTEFCASTNIEKLGSRFAIFVHPTYTEITWGSALTGHRSVVVFTGTDTSFPKRNNPMPLFLANDIATYVDSD